MPKAERTIESMSELIGQAIENLQVTGRDPKKAIEKQAY